MASGECERADVVEWQVACGVASAWLVTRALLAGRGDPDDAARAPAAVGALERCPHHVGIPRAIEGVVDTPPGQLVDVRLDWTLHLERIDAVGRAKGPRRGELLRLDVDRNDAARAAELRGLFVDRQQESQSKPRKAKEGQGRPRKA